MAELDNLYGRVPPQSKELESAVLGAIMLEKSAFDEVSELLRPECFYEPAHKIIYECMMDLAKNNQPIDLFTVSEQLIKIKKIKEVGGPYFVTKLTNVVTSSANIITHAQKIFEKFIKRELIRISGEVNNLAYDESEDCFDLLNYAENSFGDIGVKNLGDSMLNMETVMQQTLKKVNDWRNLPSDITGVPTGFTKLDRATRGWQPGDLIILGARPSVGKTAFALKLVNNAAKSGTAVAVWSLEMKSAYLGLRMLSTESKIILDKLQTGNLDDKEMQLITNKSAVSLSKLNISFDEKSGVTISSLKRKCRRLKKKENLGLVVIDYLQLMSGEGNSKSNREQDVSQISRKLKELAKELEIPIIALSQISRETGEKNIKWELGPPMSSLRESGAIEQDADVVVMLWRPSDDDVAKDNNMEDKRKVRIVKARNGVLLTQDLEFASSIQDFTEYDDGNYSNLKRIETPNQHNANYRTEAKEEDDF